MFGLKTDWSLDVLPRYFSLEDYQGGIARWCPGCGDHGVLTAVQRICRDAQLLPEKTVCVSGIGCSSRFPHYMKTYGFHGLHGRALPVACGVKSRRPDLKVWVATGDGDCCSIGAGHWVHAIRYNMDMVVMLFDNNVYGLTKNQTSPTTKPGFKSNTHPRGAFLPSLNPSLTTLSIANVSFVAQTVDWNPPHVYATLKRAFEHPGLSFVRIFQRCPVFTQMAFEDAQSDPSLVLMLEDENGITADEAGVKVFKNRLAHDPSDINKGREIVSREDCLPIGLFYANPNCPRYEDMSSVGMETTIEEKLETFDKELDRFAV